ncbi:AAEL015402-PA [Aedes aegypti]|uniref:AAEL015402-PA n=1 Tax=Aedes aegypti TaxID=7159 RepID=Q1DGZ5_AEDAE|nr:AAEL015402-PA [Aedes aegypti]
MESSSPEAPQVQNQEKSIEEATSVTAVETTDLEREEPEDGEVLEKLKGDRIGETMYSERFVLTTILKLPQLEGTLAEDEDYEKDLCSLWDMTIEKDVVLFLLKHDVIELFVGISEASEDNRLVEILLGIVGNMCCVEETHRLLYENKGLVVSLCGFLSSSDTLVLVQLMRILTTILERSDDEEYCWFKVVREVEDITEKIAFILASTTNRELIEHTLETAHAMVNRFTEAEVDYAQLNEFYKMFAKSCLIEGLMEGFKQMFPETAADNQFEEDFLSNKDLKTIQKFLEIHENFIINANEVYEDQVDKIVYCVYRVLVPMSSEGCLIPLSKAHVRILVCINSIYSAIVYHFHAGTFLAMLKIYTILAKEQEGLQNSAQQPMDEENDETDGEFEIQTAVGEILETLYFMAEPMNSSTIANTLKVSSFNEETIQRLCLALKETMAGDPLLGRTCDLLLESAREAWTVEDKSRS